MCVCVCVLILSCTLALAIYIFVGLILMFWHRETYKLTNELPIDFRTWVWRFETVQVSKLGSLTHQIASTLNARSQTDWAIKDQAKTLTYSPSHRRVSIQPTWLHCRLAFAPDSGDIHGYCCYFLMLWQRQTLFESKRDKLSSSAECRIRSWEVWVAKSPAYWIRTHKTTELSRIKQKLELR